MKKFIKWISILAGALLAILVIGIIALPLLLPLEKIKDLAAQKISETINREVKIEKVTFNIFEGIKLEGLTISNREGFSKKPFISADAIVLRYAFWPIFKRQIIVKEISLIKPEILIEKSASGMTNYSDLTKKQGKSGGIRGNQGREGKSKEKQGKSRAEKKKAFSLIVDSFSIRKGRVTYLDHENRTESEVENANLTVSGITLSLLKPIDLKFSAVATYKEKEIPLSASSKISADLEKETLKIPALTLNIAGESAQISALFSNWKTSPLLDFSLSSKKLSLDPLLAIFAAGEKPKEKRKKGELTKKVDKTMAKVSPKYRAKARIDIENLSLGGFKAEKVKLAASLSNKRTAIDIQEVKIYDGKLSGKASVDLGISGLAYNIESLRLEGFNSTPFVNTLVEIFLSQKMEDYKDLLNKVYGRLSMDLTLKGQGVEPEDIFANAIGEGSFTLTGGEIKRMKTLAAIGEKIKSNTLKEDVKFKDLHAAFALKKRVVTAKDLKLEADDVKAIFNGGADLGNMRWVPGNRLSLKLSPAWTQGLSSEFNLFRDKNGWLEITLELTGSLKTPIPMPVLDKPLEKAIGKIKLKIEAQKVEIEEKAREEVKKKTEEVKEEAKQKLEDEAKKQLKNLIKL